MLKKWNWILTYLFFSIHPIFIRFQWSLFQKILWLNELMFIRILLLICFWVYLIAILLKKGKNIEVFFFKVYVLFLKVFVHDFLLLLYWFRTSIDFLEHYLHEIGLTFSQKLHLLECFFVHATLSWAWWFQTMDNSVSVLILSLLKVSLNHFWIIWLQKVGLHLEVIVKIWYVLNVILDSLWALLFDWHNFRVVISTKWSGCIIKVIAILFRHQIWIDLWNKTAYLVDSQILHWLVVETINVLVLI